MPFQKNSSAEKIPGKVTLKAVAERVGLTPGTVSAVLNESAASSSIPEHTKKRILAAAREMNYRPNYFARTLRKQKTHTIGVIAEEIGDAYGSMIISGVERYLRTHNYFFLTVIHRHDPKLVEQYSAMLLDRGVEGLIAVDTVLPYSPPVPTVAVAGHKKLAGVTNLNIDQLHAARIALGHLTALGHSKIAFIRGQSFSSDAKERWETIQDTCRDMGIAITAARTVEMDRDDASPKMGYDFAKQLLTQTRDFTALFAYNDVAAIGAIRALQEAGLRVPDDVSVMGFDDIREAGFYTPSLTTVRQPLGQMGEIAAQTLLDQLESNAEFQPQILVEPLLVVRESTAKVKATGSTRPSVPAALSRNSQE